MSEEIECPHCHYRWTPRTTEPKYCPMCKRPLQPVTSRKQTQILTTENQRAERLVHCKFEGCLNLAMFESPLGEGSTCLSHTIEELQTMRQITEEDIYNQT